MHSQEVMNLDIIGHFEKSTKTPFLSKLHTMNMKDQIEMRQKGLLIGHLNISKKSKNTFKELKLMKLCIGEVDPFCKIVKSQLCLKLQFLLNGDNLLHWV